MDELKQALIKIIETLSSDDYPELHSLLTYYIENDEAYENLYDIATDIFNADQTKVLPPNVSDFVISIYEKMIAEGSYDAACDLGSLYYKGRFGKVDYKKAVYYYTIAADKGSRQAQENLGYCYYYGRDVEVDYKKAFHYFALGSFDGHLNSLYKIGDMYRNGYYVEKNEMEAFRIYAHCFNTLTQEALSLIGADVMLRMGDCYYEGIGVEIDWDQAFDFYYHAESMYYERLQGGDYLIAGNYKKAITRQEEIRQKRNENLPDFNWVK